MALDARFLPDRPVDDAASLQAIEKGGIPLRAQRRLLELREGKLPMSTSLSPSEGLMARAIGLETAGQVVGSSLYHVGWSGQYSAGELTNLTHAYSEGRRLALSRLTQEALALGAHLVLGVNLVKLRHEWAGQAIEFSARGTAVRLPGQPLPQFPALTTMEVDELYKLHRAGYWPVSIAIGNCYWHDNHADCVSERGFWGSSPLPDHDAAFHSCTHAARERFRDMCHKMGAQGVLGVKVDRHWHEHEWEQSDDGPKHTAFSCEVALIGTAVVRHGQVTTGEKPFHVLDVRPRGRNGLTQS